MKTADQHPFVRSFRRLPEVASTNDLARHLLESDHPPLPLLIWADRQSRGRGQRSNQWWSDGGSLTVSLILDPESYGLSASQETRVALMVAALVVQVIRELYPRCRAGVRWPNDIEVEGRKLGGILPERVETQLGPRLVIGIGLNVRTRLEEAPTEIRRMAATLAEWEETPSSVDPIDSILCRFLDQLPGGLNELLFQNDRLERRWNELDTLAGRVVRVEVGSETLEGIASGINFSGGLRLLRAGESQTIYAGRVLRH